jgi:hypothetical protein
MIIGCARVSTTEPNLGLRRDDLTPAFDASVDQTEALKTEALKTDLETAGAWPCTNWGLM